MKDETTTERFVFFEPLPSTGDIGKDKAQLRMKFEEKLEQFFSGPIKPTLVELPGAPEDY